MAVIDYPCELPDFKLGKQRQQFQTYRTNQPFAGPLFVEKITDESPVTWSITIIVVGQIQARMFQDFLRQVCSGEPFNKCILTEEGFIDHEVRFIELPLAPVQVGTGQAWEYSGVIYAAALIQEDALICAPGLIANNLQDAACIDNIVNNIWSRTQPILNRLDFAINQEWPSE